MRIKKQTRKKIQNRLQNKKEKVARDSEVWFSVYEPSIARRALENDRDLLLNDLPFCCIEVESFYAKCKGIDDLCVNCFVGLCAIYGRE